MSKYVQEQKQKERVRSVSRQGKEDMIGESQPQTPTYVTTTLWRTRIRFLGTSADPPRPAALAAYRLFHPHRPSANVSRVSVRPPQSFPRDDDADESEEEVAPRCTGGIQKWVTAAPRIMHTLNRIRIQPWRMVGPSPSPVPKL